MSDSDNSYNIKRFALFLARILSAVRTPFILFVVLAGNLNMFFCAWLFYHFENGVNSTVHHFFDALWWAFSTVSTVGYGDVVPITPEGRMVGIFLIVTGVFFFLGFSTMLVSSAFYSVADEIQRGERLTLKEHNEVMEQLRHLTAEIEALKAKK